jgi:hypothetical protein
MAEDNNEDNSLENVSDDELYAEYNRRFHPQCYLCKKELEGGISELMSTDDAIGFDPALAHVKEMLQGVVPANPHEQFGQGEISVERHGGDAIICAACLAQIIIGTERGNDAD